MDMDRITEDFITGHIIAHRGAICWRLPEPPVHTGLKVVLCPRSLLFLWQPYRFKLVQMSMVGSIAMVDVRWLRWSFGKISIR